MQIEGLCPKCGKLLQIPAELEEFSCLYCGARLHRQELCREQPKPEALEEDYQLFTQQARSAAVDWPDSINRMTRIEFFPYYERYYQQCSPPFAALERWVLAQPQAQEQLLTQAATDLMEQIEAWFPTQKGWKRPGRRRSLVEQTKFTIAIFLVPTVRQCATVIGDAFCEKLRVSWLERHPNSPFMLASYQELADGFKKRPFSFTILKE